MTPRRGEADKPLSEKAKEIVQKMIDTEAWREGLVVNDFPYLCSLIAAAITEAVEAERKTVNEANDYLYHHVIAEAQASARREAIEECIKRLAEMDIDCKNQCLFKAQEALTAKQGVQGD